MNAFENKLDQSGQKGQAFIMHNQYSVYEAKTHFSKLLREIKNGAEVWVTERGNPVARIIAIQQSETIDQKIERMILQGKILPPRTKLGFPNVGKSRPGGLKRFLKERE